MVKGEIGRRNAFPLCYTPAMLERRACAITVLNLKGGVGWTHAAWLLCGVCEERRKRLLAVDTDTQGNLTRSLLPPANNNHSAATDPHPRPRQEAAPGIEVLFDPAAEVDPREPICRTRFDHVDLIPGSPALARFDLSDQASWESSDLQFSLVDAVSHLRDDYDFIIFDCPPRLSLVSYAALCASDFVVIPLEAADWGAQGIVQVTAAVEYVRKRHNPNLALLGYLVSRFKRARRFQWSYLAKLREHFGIQAFDTVIPDLARFEQSVAINRPITFYAPASPEAAIARSLYAEIQRRISRLRPCGAQCCGRSLPVANEALAT
jgi:chromosome partitioning protein